MTESEAASMTAGPHVVAGQQWRSRDPRDRGRIVEVERVTGQRVYLLPADRAQRRSSVSRRLFGRLYERIA